MTFLREQIAGDEILPYVPENLIATGFLAAARYSGNELDKQIQRNDILVDVANTTASAFLGLTLECAECHSHKFDPISIRDYYRFQAFFVSGQPQNLVLQEDASAIELSRRRSEPFDRVHQRLINVRRKQGYPEPIYVTPKTVVGRMHPGEKKEFEDLSRQLRSYDQAWSFYSPSTAAMRSAVAPHEMRWPLPSNPDLLARMKASILPRGDAKARGIFVDPGWPMVFRQRADVPSQTRLIWPLG